MAAMRGSSSTTRTVWAIASGRPPPRRLAAPSHAGHRLVLAVPLVRAAVPLVEDGRQPTPVAVAVPRAAAAAVAPGAAPGEAPEHEAQGQEPEQDEEQHGEEPEPPRVRRPRVCPR